jgi:hypothetical protein
VATAARQVASALASDAVIEVVQAAKVVSPSDAEQWEARVVAPALALSASVGALSRGWSWGLTLACARDAPPLAVARGRHIAAHPCPRRVCGADAGMWSMAIGLFGLVLHWTIVWANMAAIGSGGLLLTLLLPVRPLGARPAAWHFPY